MSEPEQTPRGVPRVTPEMQGFLRAIRPWALVLGLSLVAAGGLLAVAARSGAQAWPAPLPRLAAVAMVALAVLAAFAFRSALLLSGIDGPPDGLALRNALAALLAPVQAAVIVGLLFAVAAALLAALGAGPSIKAEEAPLFTHLDRACPWKAESSLCVAFAHYTENGILLARSDWIILREPTAFELRESFQSILEFDAIQGRPGDPAANDIHWHVTLKSPVGRPLMRGLYSGVLPARQNEPGAGLSVSLRGPDDWRPEAIEGERPPVQGCDGDVSGQFRIDRLTWTEDWLPAELSADFESVCSKLGRIWVVVGRVRYHRPAPGETAGKVQ